MVAAGCGNRLRLLDAEDAARSLPDRYVSITQNGVQIFQSGPLPPRGGSIIGRAVTSDFRVTVEASKSVEDADGKLALVAALAGLAVAVAVALAMVQARRLTRPLQELAGAADRLGSGDASPLGSRYGIPELDRVAEGLDGSAQRISELARAYDPVRSGDVEVEVVPPVFVDPEGVRVRA